MGKTAADVYSNDAEMAKRFFEEDKRIMSENIIHTHENYHTDLSGGFRIMETIKAPLVQNGKVIGTFGISRDISEKKEQIRLMHTLNRIAEILLNTEADNFGKGLRESIELMAEAADVEKIYIYRHNANEAACRLFYDWPDECGGNGHSEILAAWKVKLSRRELVNGPVVSFDEAEREALSPFGILSVLMTPIIINENFWGFVRLDDYVKERTFNKNETSAFTSIGLIIANAIMRNETVLLAESTATKLKTVITNYPGVIWYLGADETIEIFDGSDLAKIGIKSEDITGHKLDDLASDPLHAENIKNIKMAYTEGLREWITEMNERVFHGRAALICNENGRFLSMAGSFDDITEMVRLQQKLEEAITNANDANKAKSIFLARMSHEIRTPMNAIIGLTELAMREESLDTAIEHIRTVKQAGINLLSIINDILDFSKIEQGKLEIVPANYMFSSLINDVISIIRMKVVDSQIRFVVNIDSNIPNTLMGDETRIRQILINLLSNAVKYTDKGFVSLNIYGEFPSESEVVLHIEVLDSGRGIRREDMDKLFIDYSQVDLESNRGIEGAGLGLVITYNIISAMGGNISVASEYGAGSLFTVTLPQKAVNRNKLAEVINPGDINVLLYERRGVYGNSVLYGIENLGVKCTLALNGADFEQKLKEGTYAYVFISYKMFEENKDTISAYSANTTLVLLTEFGEAIPDIKINTLPMPAHALPIANVLNGETDSFAYGTTSETFVGRFEAPEALVLVVDDIGTNLKVAEGLLLPYKMQVDLCRSGKSSLDMVKEKRYDLIFMDHRMPDMDGVETTAHIRGMASADSFFAEVPIVALTANAIAGMKEMYLANGFNDYMSKPIDTMKLNLTLEKWIPKSKQIKKSSTGRRHEQVEKSAVTDAEETRTTMIPGLDTTKGIELSGGTEEMYFDMLEIFSEDMQMKIEQIKEFDTTNDLSVFITNVHGIKSASAYIGAQSLSETARMFELAGKRDDTDFIRGNMQQLLNEIESISEKIKDAISAYKKNGTDAKNV
ncbi:MAG: ATP-binding protein [Defluviitaleaceae bacterium]|nr:ATP-binding protein [Defluviitaleaceae bacterium]